MARRKVASQGGIMSGGSWDYAYCKLTEPIEKLTRERSALRRAFGKHLQLVSDALYAIEWVDSGDYADGDDIPKIKECLSKSDELRELLIDAKEIKEQLEELMAGREI